MHSHTRAHSSIQVDINLQGPPQQLGCCSLLLLVTCLLTQAHHVQLLQFLAFRLSEVKLNCEHLTADLNMTMVSAHSSQQLCVAAELSKHVLRQAAWLPFLLALSWTGAMGG